MLTTTQKKICMMSCIMEILAIINQNAISDKNSRKRLKSILNTRIVYSLVEQQKQYIIIKNLLIAKKEVWQTTARTQRKKDIIPIVMRLFMYSRKKGVLSTEKGERTFGIRKQLYNVHLGDDNKVAKIGNSQFKKDLESILRIL